MKKLFAVCLLIQAALFTGCEQEEAATIPTPVQSGTVSGKVTMANGSPIANAKVVIENTVFHASYVYATTNAGGVYNVPVPAGSWKASVQVEKTFQNQVYKFDLHPNDAQPFAGTTGAVRNFTWQLSGAKPGGGYYGSSVAVYPDLLSGLSEQQIAIKLVPVGSLVDGSSGTVITKTLADIGGGEYGVNDVPFGVYTITATHAVTGQPLKVRQRNTGNYVDALTTIFTSGFTGSSNYQIVTEVK